MLGKIIFCTVGILAFSTKTLFAREPQKEQFSYKFYGRICDASRTHETWFTLATSTAAFSQSEKVTKDTYQIELTPTEFEKDTILFAVKISKKYNSKNINVENINVKVKKGQMTHLMTTNKYSNELYSFFINTSTPFSPALDIQHPLQKGNVLTL